MSDYKEINSDLPDGEKELLDFIQSISIPEQFLTDFYLFVAIFTEVLDRAGMDYFMHSGTALGAVRHGGFIPWDDDFDIMIEESFETRLLSLTANLKKYGILMSEKHCADGHYQYYFRNPKVPTSLARYYCFDIFIGRRQEVDGRVALHYKHPDFNKWFSDRHCFVEDVYPTVKLPFGPLMLKAMRDPADYFRRSNFRTDEATLRIHMIDQVWLEKKISYFKGLGLYPIRNQKVLWAKSEIELNHLSVDEYFLGA